MTATPNLQLNIQAGFTLIEMMIVVAIISILAMLAMAVYQDNIIRTQASEAYRLAYGLKSAIVIDIQDSKCFANGSERASTVEGIDKMTGKYGTATITAAKNGKPPCGITYTFRNSGVSSKLRGKSIVMNVNQDSVLSKNMATTVDDEYLPHAIK